MTPESVLREIQVVQKDDGVWLLIGENAAVRLRGEIVAREALAWAARQREVLDPLGSPGAA